MTEKRQLDLEQLFGGDLPGITEALAEACYEAIMICFEHHNHKAPTECNLNDLEGAQTWLKIVWARQIDDKTRRAWGDARNAIEDAAVGFAHLIMPMFTEYTIIERSRIGTGFDYWLGYKEEVSNFTFQRRARLEVSGTLKQDRPSKIVRRVKEKIEQMKQSDSLGLPAYVVVVEFGRPIVYLV